MAVVAEDGADGDQGIQLGMVVAVYPLACLSTLQAEVVDVRKLEEGYRCERRQVASLPEVWSLQP